MKITIDGVEIEVTEEKAKELRELLGVKQKTLSEVARDIFAEIDRMCVDIFGHFNPVAFAELKKKYTEDGE